MAVKLTVVLEVTSLRSHKMFEKPMNQELKANTYGNRVHTTNREPITGVALSPVAPGIKNPRNNVEVSMEGVGKDSDRLIRRNWKG
jgi:hypothetical protein